MERSKTTRAIVAALALTIALASCGSPEKSPPPDPPPADEVQSQIDSAFLAEPIMDTTTFRITDSLIRLRNDTFPRPSGRVFNLMIIGIDSRLGNRTKHADANHLVRFFLESGDIEIISIPRDTYADAGFDDTTTFNKLTNVRAVKGRREYLDAVSEITGIEPIDHYVEFGFSQAIGLLELLGYKQNASQTLRVLRARKTYRTGDFQRAYNQGRFIRRVFLSNIQRMDDIVGDLALRAALMLVESNIDYDKCQSILSDIRAGGFDDDPARIWVRLEPPIIMRLHAMSFDAENIDSMHARIETRVSELGLDSVRITPQTYEYRLDEMLASAEADTMDSPRTVIRILKRPYEQRAWLQVTDSLRRAMYRDRIGGMLIDAYLKTGKSTSANRVRDYMDREAALIEGI